MGDTDLETMANVTIAEYDYDDECFDKVNNWFLYNPATLFIVWLLSKKDFKFVQPLKSPTNVSYKTKTHGPYFH